MIASSDKIRLPGYLTFTLGILAQLLYLIPVFSVLSHHLPGVYLLLFIKQRINVVEYPYRKYCAWRICRDIRFYFNETSDRRIDFPVAATAISSTKIRNFPIRLPFCLTKYPYQLYSEISDYSRTR